MDGGLTGAGNNVRCTSQWEGFVTGAGRIDNADMTNRTIWLEDTSWMDVGGKFLSYYRKTNKHINR